MKQRQANIRATGSVDPIDFGSSEARTPKVLVGSRPVSIGQCLVKARPSDGWTVPIKLKGLSYTVSGKSASDAFNKTRDYLVKNGVVIEPLNIWFHLNRHWLPKVPASHRKVQPSALEALRMESKELQIARDGFGPQIWGNVLWATSGLYLAVSEDEYSEAEMRTIYDPWDKLFLTKKSIGCSECSVAWQAEYAKADLSTRQLAREFFVSVQNEIRARQGRSPLTFAHQAQAHVWNIKT